MRDSVRFVSLSEKRQVIIAAVLLLILSGPYFCWWITKNVMLKWLATLALGYIFFKQKGRLSKTDLNVVVIYVIAFVFYLLLPLLKDRITIFGLIDTIPSLFLVYLLCSNIDFCKKAYTYFTFLFALLMCLSIIAQFLSLSGALPSIGTIVNNAQDRVYTVYPFLIKEQVLDVYSLTGTRFSGAYDEPGAIGTIAAVILCIEKFRLSNWKNIIFLITGLMSMSLAFYIIMVVYGFLYASVVRKKILLTFVLLTSFFLFYRYTKDDPTFETLIWERIEWDDEKQGLAGEDRMVGDADYFFDSHIKGTSAYWFGLTDTTEFWKAAEGSASYKVVIAQNGMIFLALYILCFIWLAFHYKSNRFDVVIFMTLLLANTIQRPNIYSPLWVFLYAYYARINDEQQLLKS